MRWVIVVVSLAVWACVGAQARSRPCKDVHAELPPRCSCTINVIDVHHEFAIECDHVVFFDDYPLLPNKMNITEYRQRHSGLQRLTTQIFTASKVPLRKLDFSRNSIRQLSKNVWEGLEETLTHLNLQYNLLGDIHIPVFKSNEINKLKKLQTLNLAHNKINELGTDLLNGLKELQVLYLEENNLKAVPTLPLGGLTSLRALTLQENNIVTVNAGALSSTPGLLFLNLSSNSISTIEDDAFNGLPELATLDLSYNRVSDLSAGSLRGLTALEELDLSSNFLTEVPADALKELQSLRRLVLHDNRILTLGGVVALGPLSSLQHLDLTRNNVGELPTGTFRQLSGLKTLKLGVNTIRRVETEAFEGLESLETLHLDDANILSIPWTALEKVPTLTTLTLDYNRLGVISSESFKTVTRLQKLSMAHNIIREIPEGTFSSFTELEELNLYGNQLQILVPESLHGLRQSLKNLNLGLNLLSELPQFDFPQLHSLVLSKNNISILPSDAFVLLPELKMLDLSENHLTTVPVTLMHPLSKLSTLNLSHNNLTELRTGQFNGSSINVINLRHNNIESIPSEAFKNLLFLHTLDLSHNRISSIESKAFFNTALLHILQLNNNKLSSFKAEFFNFLTPSSISELRIMDLSNNGITFLDPAAFRPHAKLTWLSLSNNRLVFFPDEIVRDLTHLEHLNIENNLIKTLAGGDFANTPFLRELNLRSNQIESIDEAAFQNSTQLQDLDLSNNKLTDLPGEIFHGIACLRLDLSHNNLSTLPDMIFDRPKFYRLQSIDLAHNQFEDAPVKALKKQYHFLNKLDLSHNKIVDVPRNDEVLANVNVLDMSYNPLSEDAILAILTDQKTLRDLNLAGTNVTNVPVIETRFLLSLNLSDNHIVEIKENSFVYAKNLHTLDMSSNELPNLSFGLATAWPRVTELQYLDISDNPLAYIVRGDFSYLQNLEVLKASHLMKAERIERSALEPLKSLKELYLHTLPRVGYLDSRGILEALPGLEKVDLELMDREVHDQLHPAFYPRLQKLTIRGRSVEALSGGAFAGINSPQLEIGLVNTSVSNLQSNVFFPVPMSLRITLDVSNSSIASLSPQFLNTLDSRQRHLMLTGLATNPLFCDCNLKTLQRWLIARGPDDPLANITCSAPAGLEGAVLTSVSEKDLTCEGRPTTTTTDLPLFTTTKRRPVTQDDIITKDDTTKAPKLEEASEGQVKQAGSQTNMDTIIIGIVGGVVAFVALLIIIICLVRLRSDSQYRGGPLVGPLALRHQGNCTCLKPPPSTWGYPPGAPVYPTLPAPPPSSRAGTLKMMPPPTTPVPQIYGTVGSHSNRNYYPNPPYYMSYPTESDTEQR
ncbi:uncharacterized protein LOC143036383 [Oratosquilla oratoria]|uniref:uncharacterized protein LOC143036383 n=1 Tax=Oratosquilla oratoria TaxID=337810 RepID=UPI003F7727CE